MGQQKRGKFSKSEKNGNSNTFVELKLEYFCPKRREKGNLDLKNFSPKGQKRERELDLEKVVQVKGRRRVK